MDKILARISFGDINIKNKDTLMNNNTTKSTKNTKNKKNSTLILGNAYTMVEFYYLLLAVVYELVFVFFCESVI